MDAFVIRTPRSCEIKVGSKDCSSTSHRKSKGHQRRLNDLRGVVVLEDIETYVKKLKSGQVSRQDKLDILQRLTSKQPSTQIIVQSGIGKVVKKLSTTQDQDLAKAARVLKTRWQNLLERRVELSKEADSIEVRTDLQTRQTRQKAIKLLKGKYPDQEDKLNKLEKKIFNHYRPCVGNKYRRAIRKIVIGKFDQDIDNQHFENILRQVCKD